ncbi:ornithine cyclodeaminase family protein [Lichenibacterium dinghuense]|uniref:ornithine cyclodeaminase family protein n=1 Tax=Lichenibacterium dinghuense TaxID=2895977 RepID=UPI001F3F8659|nr:ornithine cyclodeaminase family protein [Lichenibacterium sp. 6Y81]
MRLVSADEIDRALDPRSLVEALRRAFASATYVAPTRHHHAIGREGGATHLLMPAWSAGAPGPGAYVGTKIVDVFPDNGRLGLPAVMGVYVLQSGETGAPLAVLDGTRLTHRRTAAVSALAADLLARPDASRLLLVGAGALAPHLARAHAAVRPLSRIAVWNHRPAGAERLAAALRAEGFPAEAAPDLEAAVRAADTVCCATLATAPLLRGAWLAPGQHLDLVGAFTMGMREADDACLRRARVFVDTPAALFEGGDVAVAIRDGALREADVLADLAALCRGSHPGRGDAGEVTLFKAVGTAVADLATAVAVRDALDAA